MSLPEEKLFEKLLSSDTIIVSGPPKLANLQQDDLEIVAGSRGSMAELLAPHFIENKRNAGAKFTRGLLFAASTLFFPVGLGLLGKSVVVPEGSIGIALNDGKPEIMGAGRHCLLSPLNPRYRFQTFALTAKEISCQNYHILQIGDEEFGLAQVQGQPLILGSGCHVIDDPFFQLIKRVPQVSESISHQTLHRVIVQEGKRGIAMDGDKPLLLAPGIYQRKSPLFNFKRSVNVDRQYVDLEPFFIITVFDGQVGIAFKGGVLSVLNPGEHWLNAEQNEEFLGFLPTTEQVREMSVLDILTSDGLLVRIKGSVSFRIRDPDKAMKNIGHFEALDAGLTQREKGKIRELIFGTILKRCNDTLASLLTGSDLLTSGGLGFATANSAIGSGMPKADAPSYASVAKGKAEADVYQPKEIAKMELGRLIAVEFTHRLGKHILEEWGVQVSEMDVTDIQVLDADVKKSLAAGVRANIEAATARRNAEADAETERILASGKADSTRINAIGDAAALKIKAEAEAFRILEVAKAQEEAGKMFEKTPIAVTIRLAEAGASAISGSQSSLIIAPDASTQTLLSLLGAAANTVKQTGTRKTRKSVDSKERATTAERPEVQRPEIQVQIKEEPPEAAQSKKEAEEDREGLVEEFAQYRRDKKLARQQK